MYDTTGIITVKQWKMNLFKSVLEYRPRKKMNPEFPLNRPGNL
jgi:hypothetical protein